MITKQDYLIIAEIIKLVVDKQTLDTNLTNLKEVFNLLEKDNRRFNEQKFKDYLNKIIWNGD